MKKGKIFGKKQIVLAVMVLALGAAVWLNMRFTATDGNLLATDDSSSKTYLGEATLVNGEAENATAVSGKVENEGYLEKAKTERNKTRSEAIDELRDTLKDAKAKDSVKTAAVEKLSVLTGRMESEASIEALLKAKGFSDILAVISDDDINIIIKKETLTESETIQIQDVATSQSGLSLDKVKIITVK